MSADASPTLRTKEMWRQADAVCFDVDSTVITIEPLDQLAAFCGAGEEVAQLCVVYPVLIVACALVRYA